MSLLEYNRSRKRKKGHLNYSVQGNEIVTRLSSNTPKGNDSCSYDNKLVTVSQWYMHLSQLSLSQSSVVSVARGNILSLSLSQSITTK